MLKTGIKIFSGSIDNFILFFPPQYLFHLGIKLSLIGLSACRVILQFLLGCGRAVLFCRQGTVLF